MPIKNKKVIGSNYIIIYILIKVLNLLNVFHHQLGHIIN
jgi:hypothetical protein